MTRSLFPLTRRERWAVMSLCLALLAGLDAAFWWAGPEFFRPVFLWPVTQWSGTAALTGAVAGWHLVALMDEERAEAYRLMSAGARPWPARRRAGPRAGLAAAAIAQIGLLLAEFYLALNAIAG